MENYDPDLPALSLQNSESTNATNTRSQGDQIIGQSIERQIEEGIYSSFKQIHEYTDNKQISFEVWLNNPPESIKSKEMAIKILETLEFVTDLNLLNGANDT